MGVVSVEDKIGKFQLIMGSVRGVVVEGTNGVRFDTRWLIPDMVSSRYKSGESSMSMWL